jgi:hypothetical protein
MNPNVFGLFEGVLSFGVLLAFCVWQLRSTERAKQQRIAREKAQREASERAGGGGS